MVDLLPLIVSCNGGHVTNGAAIVVDDIQMAHGEKYIARDFAIIGETYSINTF